MEGGVGGSRFPRTATRASKFVTKLLFLLIVRFTGWRL